MLDFNTIEQLDRIATPFYYYDMDLFHKTVDHVAELASAYNLKVHYAIKANVERRLLEYISSKGFGADCVSGNEVLHAHDCGFPADKIVYAGVGKSDKEIYNALTLGIEAFNCESLQEIFVINEMAHHYGVRASISVRINPDIDAHTHKYVTTGLYENKFGISQHEFDKLIEIIQKSEHIDFFGLHFHVGSQILDMSVFENLCRRVNELTRWFEGRGFALEHINVGGGLGINYDNPDAATVPDFESYFAAFARTLDVGNKQIHFELGRSIVGQCGELISRVLYRKTTPTGREVAIVDASMTELMRPALYGAHHRIVNLTSPEAPMMNCMVAGTVCESSDIFARDVELPELRRGDLVAIQSAGAYGRSMASCYNLHALPDAVYSDEI